ncbi:hypothetical protein C7I87_05610 [Mesorhizobium sp. SARCC-RB16n]|uniref:hypothetical protein n=1 Tax=Mesorhizobium sp. SARCC-RB16n TaxID=2116687 RepID=UPI00122F0159|nr:hypothetical protein [Mesorhizobium sp. SARCC-RB16n]KAA3451505.1 hypothetical protein C7I87_05610 [Mesorhizobium sp. SARCC-RB16n]
MSKNAILDQVFPVRSKSVLALQAAGSRDDATTFETLAHDANGVAKAFGDAPAAKHWHALATALEVVRFLTEWEQASLSAAIDADRFLRAARLRLKQLREGSEPDSFVTRLVEVLSAINGAFEISAIGHLRRQLAGIPLPIAIFSDPPFERPDWTREQEQIPTQQKPDLTVAFVEFKINGTTAERIQTLRPRETHDLDIAVRVSRWPETATTLVLSPVSLEPRDSYDLPNFRFSRPSGEPPYFFQQRGRMILHAPQNLKARPFEFMYSAEFQPAPSEKPVSIAGQRTLRLDGSELGRQPITGYPGIDRKLIALRDALRLEPLVPENDLEDLLAVLVPLANLMGQAVQDNKFPAAISEAEFQRQVREWLRQQPAIGVALEEQAHSTGGRTDLSFRGIRIELKSETAKKLLPEDCKHYASQPVSYAVGTNRRIAVLCVLDCSPKKEVPFPVEDGLFVYPIDTGTSPVYIVCCLIQGSLAKPSSFSR